MSATTTEFSVSHAARSILTSLGSALSSLENGIVSLSRAGRCAAESERLMQLSDAKLAEMGLTRERIPHHVFRLYFGEHSGV